MFFPLEEPRTAGRLEGLEQNWILRSLRSSPLVPASICQDGGGTMVPVYTKVESVMSG